MKYFSSFAGVGGFDLAVPEGWECVGFSEINKHANMVLKYHFPRIRNYGNAKKINWDEVPDFDVLLGGTPCQDLSIAGNRAGLTGASSSLFFEFLRALEEKKPRYFIWENVKGALSINAGWDFARVLNSFSEAGYSLWWQILDASWFGIPQHRERVFVVGSLGTEPPIKVFFKQGNTGEAPELQGQKVNTIRSQYRKNESNGSYVAESKQQAQISNFRFDRSVQNRIYGTDGIAPTLHRKTGGYQVPKIAVPVLTPGRIIKRQNGRRFKEDGEPAFTLTAVDRHGIFDGYNIRYLTPKESERLMGWPDDWTRWGTDENGRTVELSDSTRYNLIGNGVVPQVVREIINHMEVNKK